MLGAAGWPGWPSLERFAERFYVLRVGVDGHGYAHPRRFGLASHLGLLLDRPSVGCAKSRLVGRWGEPGQTFGDRTPIVDRGEVVGMAVRTRPGHAPLLVSPGHKQDVEGAVAAALACCRDGRFLPEPT